MLKPLVVDIYVGYDVWTFVVSKANKVSPDYPIRNITLGFDIDWSIPFMDWWNENKQYFRNVHVLLTGFTEEELKERYNGFQYILHK